MGRITGIELRRGGFHLLGFIVPLMALTLGLAVTLVFAATLICLYCASEALRLNGHTMPILSRLTVLCTTEAERRGVVWPPLYFGLSVLFTLTVFPAPASYAAVTVASLGDGWAKLSGKLLGRTPLAFNRQKTVEGTLIGLASAALGASLFVPSPVAVMAAVSGMMVEIAPLRVNDNLLIAPVTALAITAAAWLS